MHDRTEGLTGQHAALDLNAKAMALVRRYVQQTQTALCDGIRKTKDTPYRQLSIYKGLWTALNAADFPMSKLIEHPKILADILVQMSGVTFIHNLEVPAGIIRASVSGMHEEAHVASSEFMGRYVSALNELSDDNYNILATLNGKPPKYCSSDHSTPLTCAVDKCDAAVSPVAPPDCPAGTRCTTDACNGCQAVCAPMPVSSSSAGSAIAVMSSWIDTIRKSEGLTTTGDGVKGKLDKLINSLT